MRTVSPSVTSILETPRTASARLIFRRRKLVFTERSVSDSLSLSDPSHADASAYSTGVLRCVNYSNSLYTQFIDDMDDPVFPSWVNKSITLKANSRPGVEGEYVWYQKSNGDVCYRRQTDWSTEVLVTSSFSAETVAIAPVSGGAYVQYLDGNWLAIAHVTTGGTVTEWYGRIFGDIQTARYIDACTLNGMDYIYTMDRNAGRIIELRRKGATWSAMKYVVRIDIIDNVTGFKLGYCSVANNKILVTGRSVYTSDGNTVSMDVVAFGPGEYSISRWSYLSDTNITGKLFVIGNYVYYLGVNRIGTAPATILVGVDNTSMKWTTEDIIAVSTMHTEGEPASLQASLISDFTNAHMFDDVDLELAYNDIYTTIGKFAVDNVESARSFTEKEVKIGATGLGFSTALNYVPRQSYYTCSQAQTNSHPSELAKFIRVNGEWEGGGVAPLTLKDLNLEGILYSTGMATQTGLMRAKFRHDIDDDLWPRYGVGVNFYQESSYDVSIRLGIPQDDVTESQMGSNGIFAIYGKAEVNGNPGVKVYLMTNNATTELFGVEHTIPDNTWTWLQLQFLDGKIRVSYRADSSSTWVELINEVYNYQDRTPWARDIYGRGAIYIENGTINTTTPGCYSNDTVIPVEEVSVFPTSESIIIGSEQMTYNGKSGDITPTSEMTVQLKPSYRETSSGFTGYEVNVPAMGGTSDNQYVGYAMYVSDGTGKGRAFKITGFDAVAPQLWSPTGVYTYPDTWQDHIGEVGKGSWVASNMSRIFVEENTSGTLGDDSKVKIYSCLQSVTRAATPTTHSNEMVSLYRDLSVECDYASCFSGDVDNCAEEVITNILTGAGTPTPTFRRQYSSSQALVSTAGYWGMSSWISSYNLNVRVTIPSMSNGDEIGVCFRANAAATTTDEYGPDITTGYMVTLLMSSGNYFLGFYMCTAGTWALVEKFPFDFIPQGTMRISVHEETFSVWVEDALIMSFVDASYIGNYMAFVSRTTKTFNVIVPEMMDYIDIFAMDARTPAVSVLASLIGDRRIFFRDSADGSLYFYRTRDYVEEVPDMVYSIRNSKTDQTFSWARTESIKFVEDIDHTLAKDIGIVYQVLNAQYANTAKDVLDYGMYARKQAKANSDIYAIEMAIHPGYEPGDCIDVDGTMIDIISTNMTIEIGSGSFSCTENIDGALHA